MTSQAEFFDSFADRWDSMERGDISSRLDRAVRESGVKPGMSILDVGTGTGAIIHSLLRAMNCLGNIKAIDISAGMLRVASSKRFPDCVQFELADIEDFACVDGFYNRVICNAVFPHFTNKAETLSRMRRMLRPGGLIIISHPTGREAVNRIHREAGSAVAEDRVPNAETMQDMLNKAGYSEIEVTDEPEFYIAKARA